MRTANSLGRNNLPKKSTGHNQAIGVNANSANVTAQVSSFFEGVCTMKSHLSFLLVAAVVSTLVAAPARLSAEPMSPVIYQNDFTQRTSVEPIGESTTTSYKLGELLSNEVGDTGQDSWVRRHGGKTVKVVERGGNQYLEFPMRDSASQSITGFVCQPIGRAVSEGVLRVSADLLAPTSWLHTTSPQSRVALGDGVLHSYDPPNDDTILNHMASLFGFGANEDTRTPVRFVAYDRADDGLVLQTSNARVHGGHWYRFIADHDLGSDTYSVAVYYLGASQPKPDAIPSFGPVATFSDLDFIGAAVDEITTVRLGAVNNGSATGFDNIAMSATPERSPLPVAASKGDGPDAKTGTALGAMDPSAGPLRIGWASTDVTPDRPVLVAGMARARVSGDVVDPLTATAMVVESVREGKPAEVVVLVSCDLLYIVDALRDRVRELVKESVPEIDPSSVILNATHTHNSAETYTDPDLARKLGRLGLEIPEAWSAWGIDLGVMSPSEYLEFAAARIAAAVEQAWKERKPGGVSFGLGHAVVGHNRLTAYASGRSQMYGATDRPDFSHVEGYEDHSVNLLYTWTADRKLTGVVVNVACPSQVGAGSRISADFWHETRNELRSRLGEGLFVLPQCSAAGDQAPKVLVDKKAETRMERLTGRNRREMIAVDIADAVDSVLPVAEKTIDFEPVFAHRVQQVQISLRRLSDVDIEPVQRKFEDYLQKYRTQRAKLEAEPELKEKPGWFNDITNVFWNLRRTSNVLDRFELQKTQPTMPVEVQVIRLGDMAIATNRFELYVDYGVQIKARSKAAQTFVVQLAGQASYLPTKRSIAGGAYGAIPESTLVGPEGGCELVDQTVELIGSLWPNE